MLSSYYKTGFNKMVQDLEATKASVTGKFFATVQVVNQDGSNSVKALLHGIKGSVQFLALGMPGDYMMGADLGYHSPKPMYEGQEVQEASCCYMDGVACYYDGSSLAADRIINAYFDGGAAAVWGELVEYYESVFE